MQIRSHSSLFVVQARIGVQVKNWQTQADSEGCSPWAQFLLSPKNRKASAAASVGSKPQAG